MAWPTPRPTGVLEGFSRWRVGFSARIVFVSGCVVDCVGCMMLGRIVFSFCLVVILLLFTMTKAGAKRQKRFKERTTCRCSLGSVDFGLNQPSAGCTMELRSTNAHRGSTTLREPACSSGLVCLVRLVCSQSSLLDGCLGLVRLCPCP